MSTPSAHEVIAKAFAEENRRQTIGNIRVGCYLGMLLMPLGSLLDLFVYRDQLKPFLELRLICSVLIYLFLRVVLSRFGEVHYRKLGVLLAAIPSFFIACMIYRTEGAGSPYYAGLNLVLLVVGFVLRWTFLESLSAASILLVMYLTACLARGWSDVAAQKGIFINNLYFLVLSAIIIATGNYFQSRLRRQEFTLRHQLEGNRRMLEESNLKLKELDEAKSRFFANISHELRTPLTLLVAPLGKLRAHPPSSLSPELRQQVEMMHDNGMRLLKLINDLLELVRLESGRHEVRREPVQIEPFLSGTLNAVRRSVEDKRLRLGLRAEALPRYLMLDRDKLEKVLLNLLFNAIKFTPAGGEVTLIAAWELGVVKLSVRDTGVGIAPAHLPHIFNRFWQADDSSRRRFQGTGIGLALVKELVEAQEGGVTVESVQGRLSGTTFTVTLPAEGMQEAPSSEPPPLEITVPEGAAAESWLADLYRKAEFFAPIGSLREVAPNFELGPSRRKRPCIVIADDEPDMRRFLRGELELDFDVVEAVDGRDALQKAAQFLPDAVVLDMMMPEKDGLEVCRELRKLTATQAVPVLMLTARADDATKIASLNAGANDFLSKPFSTTELNVRVRNLVENSLYQRSLARQKQVLEATIEQLKETEVQLVQSEKMASLGRLSAGIIHEINNPLNYVKTTLYTLRRKTDAGADSTAEMLDDIKDGIDRVQGIVSSLRSFSHPSQELRADEPVEVLVQDALRFVSHETRGAVSIVTSIPPGQKLTANRSQIIQVFVNLLQNSVDAFKQRGERAESPTIWIEGTSEAELVRLVIRDNGCGIPQDHLSRIFDPFFTTKEVGQGMGLGLSICYRIVQDHGGRITVQSERDRFSQFTLEFPSRAGNGRRAA